MVVFFWRFLNLRPRVQIVRLRYPKAGCKILRSLSLCFRCEIQVRPRLEENWRFCWLKDSNSGTHFILSWHFPRVAGLQHNIAICLNSVIFQQAMHLDDYTENEYKYSAGIDNTFWLSSIWRSGELCGFVWLYGIGALENCLASFDCTDLGAWTSYLQNFGLRFKDIISKASIPCCQWLAWVLNMTSLELRNLPRLFAFMKHYYMDIFPLKFRRREWILLKIFMTDSESCSEILFKGSEEWSSRSCSSTSS